MASSVLFATPASNGDNSLRKRLFELEKENKRLLQENQQLRAQLKEPAAARTILGAQSPNLVFEEHTPIDLTFAKEEDISPISPPPKMPRFQTPPENQHTTPSEAAAAAPASPTPPSPATATAAETEEEALMASIRLAQQLMQEEEERRLQEWQQAAMSQSLQMHQTAGLDSNSDLALAVQLQRQESALAAAGAEGADMIDEEDDPEGEEDELTYEQMLEIGEQIGDVKKDQWKERASQFVNALPQRCFACPSTPEAAAASSISASCLICTCEYESGDKIKDLPCGHFYHTECVDTWLLENNSCPVCKKSISTPQKPAESAAAASATTPTPVAAVE